MIWITPVKDRKENDLINKTPKAYINASDLNRIENNIAYLANLHKNNYIALESLMAYYGIPEDTPGLLPTYDPDALDNLVSKTDWASSDFVLAENSERIIGNINYLEAIMQESEQFPKWLTVTSLDKLDLRGANNIEFAIENNYHFANFTFKKYKDKIMENILLEIRLTGKSEQAPGTPLPSNPLTIDSAGNCDLLSENQSGTMSSSVQIPWLRSTADVADTLTYIGGGDWLYTQRCYNYTFDGSEYYPFELNGVGGCRVNWRLSDRSLPRMKLVTTNVMFPGFCTHLQRGNNNAYTADNTVLDNSIATSSVNQQFRMKFAANLGFTSSADVKAWFTAQYNAGTPVTVQYELEEPISSVLQLGGLLKFQPETLVYTNGEIEPEISIEE